MKMPKQAHREFVLNFGELPPLYGVKQIERVPEETLNELRKRKLEWAEVCICSSKSAGNTTLQRYKTLYAPDFELVSRSTRGPDGNVTGESSIWMRFTNGEGERIVPKNA